MFFIIMNIKKTFLQDFKVKEKEELVFCFLSQWRKVTLQAKTLNIDSVDRSQIIITEKKKYSPVGIYTRNSLSLGILDGSSSLKQFLNMT